MKTKSNTTRKLALAGILTAVAVVGSLISVPVAGSKCAPVQHMVNVFAAVVLGPWWGVAIAFCASLLRNLLGIGSLMAFPGSMVGALCCGLVYHFSKRISLTCVAEALGTGVLGGLGGIVYITAGVSEWKFENGVAGFGFLALAVMIFGQWKPTRIALAALLFGLFRALSNVYSGFPLLASLQLPGAFYNILPYLISLIVLAFTSKQSRAPKAEGIPYDKGGR